MAFRSAKSIGKATRRFPYRSRLIVFIPLKFSISGVVIEYPRSHLFKMKIRSILSKEDSFRRLLSNGYLDEYNEDEMSLDVNRD
ncbi:hypothetical protein Bca4012_002019 [Brassica carinata]